jgi:hypothetical protein
MAIDDDHLAIVFALVEHLAGRCSRTPPRPRAAWICRYAQGDPPGATCTDQPPIMIADC